MNQKYIAVTEHSYDPQHSIGTLNEILEEMEENKWDVDDFSFYEVGKAVRVTIKKELLIVEKLVEKK